MKRGVEREAVQDHKRQKGSSPTKEALPGKLYYKDTDDMEKALHLACNFSYVWRIILVSDWAAASLKVKYDASSFYV